MSGNPVQVNRIKSTCKVAELLNEFYAETFDGRGLLLHRPGAARNPVDLPSGCAIVAHQGATPSRPFPPAEGGSGPTFAGWMTSIRLVDCVNRPSSLKSARNKETR